MVGQGEHNRIDILAVVVDVGLMMENSPVLQAQVGDQLLVLRSMGFNVGLLCVVRDTRAFDEVIGSKLRDAAVSITLVVDRGFIRNLFALASALRSVCERVPLGTLYVRGLWGPVVIAFARRGLPYVYDVRGALDDESAAAGTGRIKRAIYRTIEAWGIRRSRSVTAVSVPLARAVEQRHGVSNVSVIPCCIDVRTMQVPREHALRRRAELGYDIENIVFVYSGGLTHYQQVPAMLELWREFIAEPDVRFLFLTSESPQRLQQLAGDLQVFGSRFQQLSLPRAEIPLNLAAANIGFMLRDRRELNRVASPVKFPEYLAAGLAIVASPGTGDVSDLIVQHRVGALVDPANFRTGLPAVRRLLHELRADPSGTAARARALASQRYDWAAHTRTFRTLYT